MVCLRLGTIVVSIVVSIVSVAASVATAGNDMPTVMVVADNQVDGPAGWLACRQIRHWPATAPE